MSIHLADSLDPNHPLAATSPTLLGWFDARDAGSTAPRLSRDADTGTSILTAPGLELKFQSAHVAARVNGTEITLHVWRYGEPPSSKMPFDHGVPPRRGSVVRIDLRARRLEIFSDRFAVQSVCYSSDGSRFWFSDRADAIAQAVNQSIDPQALYDYVYFHVIPSPRTVFRSVLRMSPARRLEVDADGLTEHVTWAPRFDAIASPPPLRKRFAEFRSLLEAAVRREADEDQTGAFLSGGTDSSTVVGLLSQVHQRPPMCFSIGFEAEGYDEMAYARIAARHFGVEHHEYYVTPDDLVDGVPQVAAQYDQPFGNSSALPAFYCARLAREYGVTKILAGDGGDELFGGNTRYAKQKVFAAYNWLPRSLRWALLEPLLARSSPLHTWLLVQKVASYVDQARIPMPDRTETYNLLNRFGAGRVFPRALLLQVDQTQPLSLQHRVYAETDGAALVDRMLAYDWRFTLADTDLPKVTGTTALAGLHVGFPMLDDALVDFSLTLSPSEKVRGVQLRWFFKRALRDFLPRDILRKSKHGFGLPFGPWVVKNARLRGFAEAALRRLVDRNVIEKSLVDDLFSVHLREHPGYYGEMIWILMMLEYWLVARMPSFAIDRH